MKSIGFSVDDAEYPRVIAALAGRNGYRATVQDRKAGEVPNPESQEDFAHRIVGQYLRDETRAFEGTVAERTAKSAIVPVAVVVEKTGKVATEAVSVAVDAVGGAVVVDAIKAK